MINRYFLLIFLMASLGIRAHQPSAGKTGDRTNQEISPLLMPTAADFPIFDCIKTDVDFWARVYREWDSNQVVIYDTPTKIIYDVVNLPRVEFGLSSAKYKKEVEKRVKEITEALKLLGQDKKHEKTPLAAKLENIAKKNSLLSEPDLSARVRFQNGLRSQFEYGLKVSGRYADDMAKVLRSEELPDELLAMVFVESLFYPSAVSHKGAVGLWGIVRETALRSGIYVNKFTDERLDPMIATWAASRYLKKAKSYLSEWPLVFTAYNYGTSGMIRAVNNLKSSNLCEIIKLHDGASFKYASKSYYSSVLAALDTLKNQTVHFPGLKKEELWQYELVQLERPVHVDDLITSNAINREDLVRLNPALTKNTITGDEVIPPDYSLRVPKGKSAHFYKRLKKIPREKRLAAGAKISTKYVAKGRESLNHIANLFGIKADSLSKKMNKPLTYKPVGPVNIRSETYRFFDKSILSDLSALPGPGIEKLPQIEQFDP